MQHHLFKGRQPFQMLKEWQGRKAARDKAVEVCGYYIGSERHTLYVFYETETCDRPANE